jgi:molybdopterin converting factor small subunit
MARVVVRTVGQSPVDVVATTVGDLKTQLGVKTHSASVNKEPAGDDYVLADDDYVTLAPNVKGG